MNNNFELRMSKHDKSWDKLLSMVQDDSHIKIAKIGTEHILPNIHKLLIDNHLTDCTSRWLRYQPDAILVNLEKQQSYYVEVKSSDNIEKEAYLTYKKLAEIGCNVVLFILSSKNEGYIVPVEEIVLVPGHKTVKHYSNQLPVDKEDWIAPRLMDRTEYSTWKEQHSNTSGTPYRRFDFEAMEKYKR